MTPKKILIVDDDQEIIDLIKLYLENEQFVTDQALNGKEAWDKLHHHATNYDLIITDYMMPEMDGIELARLIRNNTKLPIIILSARDNTIDKIHGLTIGADDYLPKPFHPLELVARVKALIRRYQLSSENPDDGKRLMVKDLVIDLVGHQVSKNNQPINLTPKEFAILELLAAHPGQVFSANHIFESVWGQEPLEGDNTVMTHLRNLRHKLADDSKSPKYIITIWGIGYKIEN